MSEETPNFIEQPTKYRTLMENPSENVNNSPIRNEEELPAINNFLQEEYPSELKTNDVMDALKIIMANQSVILNNQTSFLDSQRQLESRLAVLEETVKAVNFAAISDDIRQMKKSLGRLTGEHSIDDTHCDVSACLPLSTVEAINELETNLQNKDTEMAMRDYILMIKGTAGTIDQVLRQVFTDEAMHHFNFEGKQGKRSFVELRVRNIIYDVFQMHGRFQIDKDIRKYIEMSHNRQKSRNWQKQHKITDNSDSTASQQPTDSYFQNLPDPSVIQGMLIKSEETLSEPENIAAPAFVFVGGDNPFAGHLGVASFDGSFASQLDASCNGAFDMGDFERLNQDFQKEISFSLPLNSVEAIETLEGKLQNPDFLSCLKQYVWRMKGDSGSIKDVLRHVFKDDAISHYNFDGVHGKRSFVMLQFMQKVICSVFQHLGKLVIHRDVKRFIEMSHNRQKSKLWLRKQKDNMKNKLTQTEKKLN